MSKNSLHGLKLLAFVGDDYEDLELWYPKLRMAEAGVSMTLAGLEAGQRCIGKNGYPCKSDAAIRDMNVDDFDGVLCAGGWMPDKLRRDPQVLELIRQFHERGQLIAAICHGGWMPISAKVYSGVKVTGSPGIKDDLINAGAVWADAPVIVDRHFVSSRKPDDLPDFCVGMLQVLTEQVTRSGR
jgi:protease I